MATDAERIEHDARRQAPRTTRLSFPLEAGRLLRRSVRSTLLRGAFDHGVQMHIEEDRGWLGSTFYVTVVAPPTRSRPFEWRTTSG
jgi:hypothetical protein